MVVAGKEEVGCRFNILTASTHWAYAVLKVVSEFVGITFPLFLGPQSPAPALGPRPGPIYVFTAPGPNYFFTAPINQNYFFTALNYQNDYFTTLLVENTSNMSKFRTFQLK